MTEIHEISALREHVRTHGSLKHTVLQNIDLTEARIDWAGLEIEDTTFLGCKLTLDDEVALRRRGAYLYFPPRDVPYNPYRRDLYTWRELMDGWTAERDASYDLHIYEHFRQTRHNPPINAAMLQRIHDHNMDEGIRNLVEFDDRGMTRRRCVGIMGGHSTRRDDPFYTLTARTAFRLAQTDYLVVSGGGPGTMEAANLGAYFGDKTETELLDAIRDLQRAPHYADAGFHQRAFEVLERYPVGAPSLAIPTWFYGHEPSNLFATHIAKYFSNSLREDMLLAVCLYGIVYAPGSAGTTQEIFQDATQNHYGTFDYYSPMVFLGEKRYAIDTLLYPLLRQLSYGRRYHELLHLTDEPDEVVRFIQQHPPIHVGG